MAQLVEHNLAKVGVAGSSPVVRSKRNSPTTTVAGLFLYLSPRLEPERGRFPVSAEHIKRIGRSRS